MSDCPVCHRQMSSATVGAVAVDNCGQCGGNWTSSEGFGKLCGMRPSDGRHLTCPSCRARMQTRQIQNQSLDVCPSCGGIWADAGELRAITGKDPDRGTPLGAFRAFKQCPSCSIPMRVLVVDGVEIENCPKCEGTYHYGQLGLLGPGEEYGGRHRQSASSGGIPYRDEDAGPGGAGGRHHPGAPAPAASARNQKIGPG